MQELLILIGVTLFFVILLKGLIKVLVSHFWLALLMMFLLTPLFMLWIFVEGL